MVHGQVHGQVHMPCYDMIVQGCGGVAIIGSVRFCCCCCRLECCCCCCCSPCNSPGLMALCWRHSRLLEVCAPGSGDVSLSGHAPGQVRVGDEAAHDESGESASGEGHGDLREGPVGWVEHTREQCAVMSNMRTMGGEEYNVTLQGKLADTQRKIRVAKMSVCKLVALRHSEKNGLPRGQSNQLGYPFLHPWWLSTEFEGKRRVSDRGCVEDV